MQGINDGIIGVRNKVNEANRDANQRTCIKRQRQSALYRLPFLHTFQCTGQVMSFKSVPTGAYIPSLDNYHYRNIYVLCQ